MCWKDLLVERQRLEMVTRVVRDGVGVSRAAREFGVSRKTCHKWVVRYRSGGLLGLSVRKSGPKRSPHEMSASVALRILELKRKEPRFGPKKILALLCRELSPDLVPSLSGVSRLLRREGLTEAKGRGRRKCVAVPGSVVSAVTPNDLWTMDFKGHWPTLAGSRCMPLTVQDAGSRFVLLVRPLARPDTAHVQEALEKLFGRYGMPLAVRFDNGSPFASTSGPHGLSRLGAWLLERGIAVERMAPGHPEQNGRHERMHGDLAGMVAARRFRLTLAEEVLRLEEWRQWYNGGRPHEALGMRCPGEVYRVSARAWSGAASPWQYPVGWETRRVKQSGEVCLGGEMVFVSESLGGRRVGVRELAAPSQGAGGVTLKDAETVTRMWEMRYCGLELGVVKGRRLEAAWRDDTSAIKPRKSKEVASRSAYGQLRPTAGAGHKE